MSEYRYLQLEQADGCVTLWLNRPERHNALNAPLIAELHHAIDEVASREDVRVVVLSGRGASFCAGGDLEWMRAQAAAPIEQNLQDARHLGFMLRTLASCAKPTVACVHGAALGGGLGLVAACDLVIASASAQFGATETRLGLAPSSIAPYISAAIGERAARAWFLLGERFAAQQVQRLGLVHQVVEPESLETALQSLLATLRLGAPQAQQHSKWLMGELRGLPPRSVEQLEECARSLASVRAGAEAREGIEAFFERRKPAWAR
ncbi:MAG TPA: enoyl-CoA hydratase-related protein [Steroidobacteraceae bacterium]|jgi:methylglutaconyl-CoA hydratase|nr:enoyl-CoA hydratase-related protein [Steroidobacteraceae bacterium]